MTAVIPGTRQTVIRRAESRCIHRLHLLAIALCVTPAAASEVIDTPMTDRKPLNTVVPVYPEKARRERIEGEVQVCFEITRDGRTRRIAVRKSTHRIFEKPSRRAVRSMRFPCATKTP